MILKITLKNWENNQIAILFIPIDDKLKTYKAVGLALYSYVAEEDIKVIKVMAKYGLIYYKADEDLKDNDEFLNELDIQDIYIILGYYLINFTMKQLV